jgi:hypothetical protein
MKTTRLSHVLNRTPVSHSWKPKECPRCFSDEIVFWRQPGGFDCFCPDCKKCWEEVFSKGWNLNG